MTVKESLRKVKALSKKSIEAAFVFPEVKIMKGKPLKSLNLVVF